MTMMTKHRVLIVTAVLSLVGTLVAVDLTVDDYLSQREATDKVLLRLNAENKRLNERSVEQNQIAIDSLAIIKAVTNCTGSEPAEECRKRLAEASIKEGNRRIDEVDCRVELILQGVPFPERIKRCRR